MHVLPSVTLCSLQNLRLFFFQYLLSYAQQESTQIHHTRITKLATPNMLAEQSEALDGACSAEASEYEETITDENE